MLKMKTLVLTTLVFLFVVSPASAEISIEFLIGQTSWVQPRVPGMGVMSSSPRRGSADRASDLRPISVLR